MFGRFRRVEKEFYMLPFLLILTMLLLSSAAPSFAQSSSGGPRIESLKVDGKQVGREAKVQVYKQLLHGGKVYVAGKVAGEQGTLSGVGVSRDNGKTWFKAALTGDGSFEYSFRPQAPAVYTLCLRVTDEKGARAPGPCVEVAVSEKSPYVLVRETIDKIVEAYEEKNLRLFMSHVSEDFFGDKTVFEGAVRNAESAYTDIDVRYTIDSIVPDYNDKIFVSLTFNRRYTIIKTGKTVTDSGSTSFILRMEEGQLKVLSMSKPLMFL